MNAHQGAPLIAQAGPGSAARVQSLPWQLWRRQSAAIFRMEFKKIFSWGRRWAIYGLALAPVFIIATHALDLRHQHQVRLSRSHSSRLLSHNDFAAIAHGMSKAEVLLRLGKPEDDISRLIVPPDVTGNLRAPTPQPILREHFRYVDAENNFFVAIEDGKVVETQFSPLPIETIEEDTTVFAEIFQIYFLRLGIFFGCMGIFTWLFRGEIVERNLHYYFLAPVRRDVLVVSKFAAAACSAILVFWFAVLCSFALIYLPFGAAGSAFVFNGPGLGHLVSYLSVTVLACLGYGAAALALSLIFRHIAIPGIILLGWETISPALPPLLQKLSVTHYLKQLVPVPVPAQGLLALFTVVTEPVAPWMATLGLVTLTGAVLIFACVWVRRLEISYVND